MDSSLRLNKLNINTFKKKQKAVLSGGIRFYHILRRVFDWGRWNQNHFYESVNEGIYPKAVDSSQAEGT